MRNHINLRKFLRMIVPISWSAIVVLVFLKGISAAATEKVIYSFIGGNDEGFPYAGLVFDAKGNLYGTTAGGGLSDYYGTVFRLSPTSSGT
jgi:uncharacterized repeat protein (TIGR03803 family)